MYFMCPLRLVLTWNKNYMGSVEGLRLKERKLNKNNCILTLINKTKFFALCKNFGVTLLHNIGDRIATFHFYGRIVPI